MESISVDFFRLETIVEAAETLVTVAQLLSMDGLRV